MNDDSLEEEEKDEYQKTTHYFFMMWIKCKQNVDLAVVSSKKLHA